MSNTELYQTLSEKFPFITYMTYGETEHVGIVQNMDHHIITVYDYTSIPNIKLKKKFLELGEIWWWESNRMIPINIFLKEDWNIFKEFARTYNLKDIEIIHGPIVNLNNFNQKRIKSRSVQLIRRIIN